MIGFVVAMKIEADALLSICDTEKRVVCGKEIYSGNAFGKDFVLVLCGIGKVNAAIGTQILISSFNVDKIVNFGVAGGLNSSTELCKVYAIEKAVQFDFDLVQLNGTAIGTLDEYKENYLPLTSVPSFPRRALGTADRFNDSKTDYALLTSVLKTDIRDMEGGAVVQTALKAKLPVYSFKAISDVAGSGSTTDQYLKNRETALKNLQGKLGEIFAEL